MQEAEPADLKAMPAVVGRMRAVRAFRKLSKRKSTLAIPDAPRRYNVEVLPVNPFLVIPEVSSERRRYVPIGWLEPPTIPSNRVRIVENASLELFALLTSAMHMTWLRHVGRRLEGRYRYSIGLVYNSFPAPSAKESQMRRFARPAQGVLKARKIHSKTNLADLYSHDLMPSELRDAHRIVDRAVDRLYRRKPFRSDQERFEHLLTLDAHSVDPAFSKSKLEAKDR